MGKRTSSTINLTFANPFDALFETVASIKDTTLTLLDEISMSTRQDRVKMNKIFSGASMPKFNFNKKTGLQLAIPLVLILVLGIVVFSVVKKSSGNVAGVSTSSSEVKTLKLNREFKFPLKDDKGKKAGEFTYVIESAELRKKIIVKGQTATAVEGRIFLVVNIKIINELKQGLSINSRDYIRFETNNNTKELFAADIHNDPVEAQAISTKNTRVGLAINEQDQELKLQVGEIDGTKTTIPLEFK